MTAITQIPAEIVKDRQEVLQRARSLQIADQQTYDYAAESLAWAAALEKKIEAHYEPLRVAAKNAYDAVLNAKKTDLAPLLEIKLTLAKKTADYEREQERIRQEAQRLQDEAAIREAEEKRKAEIAEAKKAGATKEEIREIKTTPIAVHSPTVDPTHRRSEWLKKPMERWHANVLGDAGFRLLVKAVAKGDQPLELLLPNQVALNKMAGTFKAKMQIPGVEAVSEFSTSVKGGVTV